MAQVSKYPVSKKVADRIFEVFVKTFVKIKDNQEAENFASDLFSPTEKIMMAKRIAIAFLLMRGYQYRQICNLLRVSLATVASVKLSLRYGKNGYQTILNRIARDEKLEEFFVDIATKLFSVGQLQRKGSAWRYLDRELAAEKERQTKKF